MIWTQTTAREIDNLEAKGTAHGLHECFDLLILPMLQWSAGIYATFALMHLAQAGFARLLGLPGRRPGVGFSRGSASFGDYRPTATRVGRPRVRPLGLSR